MNYTLTVIFSHVSPSSYFHTTVHTHKKSTLHVRTEGGEQGAVSWEQDAPAGAQFTCFTDTKVLALIVQSGAVEDREQKSCEYLRARHPNRFTWFTCFTCFTCWTQDARAGEGHPTSSNTCWRMITYDDVWYGNEWGGEGHDTVTDRSSWCIDPHAGRQSWGSRQGGHKRDLWHRQISVRRPTTDASAKRMMTYDDVCWRM